MHGASLKGPVDLGVGEGLIIRAPQGDITVTVAAVEGDEVRFEVSRPEEVLATIDAAASPLARAA